MYTLHIVWSKPETLIYDSVSFVSVCMVIIIMTVFVYYLLRSRSHQFEISAIQICNEKKKKQKRKIYEKRPNWAKWRKKAQQLYIECMLTQI